MSNQIANTILQQLGGSKISSFIGVKQFVEIKNGLQVRWTAKAKNKSNLVTISLNGNDLYDVRFYNIRGVNITIKSEHIDMYCDQLIDLFETETGLYLHF
jgi:hypothetical protein